MNSNVGILLFISLICFYYFILATGLAVYIEAVPAPLCGTVTEFMFVARIA